MKWVYLIGGGLVLLGAIVALIGAMLPRDHHATRQARYRQINEFERMLTESGTEIVKICLHVSKKEQHRRLAERLKDPEKNWKISASDLDDRGRWHDYTVAYRDMLSKCSTRWAPWYVVPSNRKWFRDLIISERIVNALKGLRMRYPPLPPGLRASRVR